MILIGYPSAVNLCEIKLLIPFSTWWSNAVARVIQELSIIFFILLHKIVM